MAAKYREGLSLVIPNAYFCGLSEDSQKKAKEIFFEAAIGAAKEIKRDSENTQNFVGYLSILEMMKV